MADDPWAAFRLAPQSDVWAEFRGNGNPEYAQLSTQDLRNMAVAAGPGSPVAVELKRRNDLEVASAPKPSEPSDFDVMARNQTWRDWRDKRGWLDSAKETAAFAASLPVRMLTRGQYGAGDVVGAVSPSAGAAVSRGESDFARAHPDAMWTMGAVGEVSGGIMPMTGIRARPRVNPNTEATALRATQTADDFAAAQRLGVEVPGFAYSSGPTASVAKQLSETPVIGTPARRAIERSIGDIGGAADDVAARYGDGRTMQQAGQTAEAGLTRFKDARPADVLDDAARNLPDQQLSEAIRAPARDTSLKSKQAVLYERAWRQIPEEMRQGRSVEGGPRVMGNPSETRAVLRGIIDRNARMTQRSGEGAAADVMPVSGGLLGRVLQAIDNPRWTANLQTMRDIRSEIRRLASGMPDTERNVLRLSDLERLQGAMTTDMVAQLQNNANRYRAAGNVAMAERFERSIRMFRQADRFTRLSAERLETVERLFNAPNAEALARGIAQTALNQGRGNLEALRTLRRILRPDEMSQISSVLIRELGTPVGSARGAAQAQGFSVQSFLTRWQNMSPEARGLLFDGPHRSAINDLVRVANRLANVEALANTSRSGTNTLNVGSVLAAGGAVATGAVDTITAGLGSAAAGFTTAYLLSRPQYARWLANYLDFRARRMRAGDRRPVRGDELIRQLGAYAAGDPALAEVYNAVRRER